MSMWDLKKFFDSENLIDCMSEMYKSNVKGKIYRLLYKMNQNIRISVKTPVGDTEFEDTDEGVGQGTVEGTIISSTSIDKGVSESFEDELEKDLVEEKDDKELHRIISSLLEFFHPIIFQDDVNKLSTNVMSAQNANRKMEHVIESKLLSFNADKSCVLILGEEKARKKLSDDLKENPLILDGKPMKHVTSEKFLGDHLSVNLSESIHITVRKRIGLATSAIYEIRTIVDDTRSDSIGGLTVGFQIWEMAVIPMLLSNAGTWIGMKKKTMKELDKIQLKFLRLCLAVGNGCPIPLLLTETGTLLMSNRILRMKLLFLFHLINLPPDSLASKMLTKELEHENEIRGLVSELLPVLTEFGTGFDQIKTHSKYTWRKFIREKIFLRNKSELLQMSEKYKKIDCESLSRENFTAKQYFKTLTVSQSRLKFRLNSRMTNLANNYHRMEKYRKIGYACVGCSVVGGEGVGVGEGGNKPSNLDTTEHVVKCEAYSDLRIGKDLINCDRDLVTYFQAVLTRRIDEEQS